MEKKKMGRPTTNPKPYKITVRLDEKSKQILDKYCENCNVSIMEAVRRAIYNFEKNITDGGDNEWS